MDSEHSLESAQEGLHQASYSTLYISNRQLLRTQDSVSCFSVAKNQPWIFGPDFSRQFFAINEALFCPQNHRQFSTD